MIRALLITTVVSFVVAVVAFTGSAQLGGGIEWPNKDHWNWSKDVRNYPSNEGDDFAGDLGQRASRDYVWNGDDQLEVNLPGEVVYTQGADAKVTITAPQAVLDVVHIEDGEIFRTGKRMKLDNARMLIVIQAPNVSEFRFNGGQKVTIKSYAQDELEIESNGAAEILAEGTARSVDLRMNGAGHADLSKVVNDEAKVELNGASHAELAPKTAVDIRINGVGNVSLATRPAQVKQEIHGIGSVTFGPQSEGLRPPALPAAPKAPAAPRLPATAT